MFFNLVFSHQSHGFQRVNFFLSFLTTEAGENLQRCSGREQARSARHRCPDLVRPRNMKVEIEEWHAVSTWTWNAEDDSCGICRRAVYFAFILNYLAICAASAASLFPPLLPTPSV